MIMPKCVRLKIHNASANT